MSNLRRNATSLTPTPSGGTGAVANVSGRITALAELMATGRPTATDETLAALWKQRLGSSPEEVRTPVYSDGQFDEHLAGFLPAPREDADLIALLEAANGRADPNVVIQALARLKVATVGRNMAGIDIEAWLAVMGDALEEFPTDVVLDGCRRYSRREKWTPSEAELRQECLLLVRWRRKLLKAARRPPDAPARSVNAPRPILPRPDTGEEHPFDRHKHMARYSDSLRRVREETARMREAAIESDPLMQEIL